MIIYNVTIQVDEAIAPAWLSWLQEEHIPDVMGTGCFVKHQLVKILSDEPGSTTYAVQYYANDRRQVDRYLNEYAGTMRKKGMDKWGDRFIAFRTLMEVVN
ncbi:MAG TPA: DUF4286 family protein [Chitinophagaceae bacterium]|nr:DUF4286 family protein [Chitinophagaceae bacterium]